MNNLLQIKDLEVSFNGNPAVKNLNLNLPQGTTYALVGESGSGKSVTCSTILGLLPQTAKVQGEIIYEGKNLISETHFQKNLRGKKFGYIPQNPITSLNPVRTVYSQIRETIQTHKSAKSESEIKEEAKKLLADVQLDDYEKVFRSYPFELSGGMCQRIMIAMSLICDPILLIADEPTTALDVTIQAEIMNLLLNKVKEKNLSLLLITHDLAVVAQSCEYVSVLRAGNLCEEGKVREVFANPQNDYTQSLLTASCY